MRNLLEKRGGQLGKTNSVTWKFDRKGVLGVSKEDVGEEELFEQAIEAGADNVEDAGETYEVLTLVEDFETVRAALQSYLEEKRGMGAQKKWGESEDERPVFTRTEFVFIPQSPVVISDPTKAQALLTFLEDLEDHEDVQAVHSDLDVPDEVFEACAADGG
jgi:transcriptional/translational regulatory protein YebC/TACO1